MDDLFSGEWWDQFVADVRVGLIGKLVDSAVVMNIVPAGGEPDIKYAVELGLSIMYDKPIVLLVLDDTRIPEHLNRVADAVILTTPDEMDTEAGRDRLMARMKPILDKLAQDAGL